jgi:ubiquinone/menaquinone biosynthesis C-methylase UbiE
LYSQRLARFGHTVHGIDFSPASIAYARQAAESEGVSCNYTFGDVRAMLYTGENDLVMFIYGEINVFCPADARTILTKANKALRVGGRLLLEPHPDHVIRELGNQQPTWYTTESGLFSDRPHLMLQESFWDEAARAATNRYMLIDAATSQVTRYAASYQAYTHAEYHDLLEATGFSHIEFFPSLTGEDEGGNLIAIVAQKS